ncbi:MAG: hypothetical protein DRJ03_00600 [Chloroflexi bacterium]|nr:MAG: hypothetical protein DRJ03_00600 [Chloroflexota bacterium]
MEQQDFETQASDLGYTEKWTYEGYLQGTLCGELLDAFNDLSASQIVSKELTDRTKAEMARLLAEKNKILCPDEPSVCAETVEIADTNDCGLIEWGGGHISMACFIHFAEQGVTMKNHSAETLNEGMNLIGDPTVDVAKDTVGIDALRKEIEG